MKIKIPHVVVTAVKGREVNDVVFVDTASKKNAAEVVKARTGARVLSTTAKRCEFDIDYEDATCEVIFTAVCHASGANVAYDDIISDFVPIPAESAGDSND